MTNCRSRIMVVTALTTVGMMIIVFPSGISCDQSSDLNNVAWKRKDASLSLPHQKLLSREEVEQERIWKERCSKSDIVINQGQTPPRPNGTPTYTVEIINLCNTGCSISGIHLNCGWFSSATLVNPHVFKRIAYNDCVVNDGKPLGSGRTFSFRYANTFRYQLSVSKVIC